MEFFASTVITMALMAALVALGPGRGLWVVFALTPFGMLAFVNLPAVGGTSITGSDLSVLVLAALLARRGFAAGLGAVAGPGTPGLTLLVYLAYAVLITLFAPRLFAGMTEVYGIARAGNTSGIVLVPLAPSTGNLSQLMRMALSLLAFFAVALAVWRWPDPRRLLVAVTLATGLHVALGLADITTNALGAAWLLEPLRTANYSLTLGQQLAGLNRMIGGMPEAATFGYYALGLVGFWLAYLVRSPGRPWFAGLMLALSVALILRATSSSGYVGLALFVPLFGLVLAVNAAPGRLSPRAAALLIGALAALPVTLIAVYMAYDASPQVAEFLDRSLINKLDSTSGTERASWNAQALVTFGDTWGLGAGLGSLRASNWQAGVLGTTGVAGAALMLAALVRLFTLPLGHLPSEARHMAFALKMGCLAFLCRAVIVKGSPNLDIIFFVFAGACAGLVAAYSGASRRVNR